MQRQFGRSMIEMLGVLAIIGVLSIGGLLGYRRAVNNHQANQILDDANRLAFAVIESNQTFQANSFMEEDFIDSVPYTGTYNLDAFMAAGGQFGIVVTNVPRGVCESLISKASIEYKVRVMPGSEERYSVPQMSNIGIVYDSFHKDICNGTNDVVLYFGDTSGQCNKPDEGETYAKCLSNADCCGGWFCWYPNDSDCKEAGIGRCEEITETNFASNTKTMSDGHTWVRCKDVMNWWSAQNWCTALGLKPASRPDTTSSAMETIQNDNSWNKYGYYWLEDAENSCGAYLVTDVDGSFNYHGRNNTHSVLCY